MTWGIDLDNLGKQRRQVALAPEQTPDGRCDGWCCQTGCRDLVQQWLKKMVVGLVDQSNVNGRLCKRPGCFKSPEASANNQDTRPGCATHQSSPPPPELSPPLSQPSPVPESKLPKSWLGADDMG